jgi:hypothetical protein
LFQKVVPIVGKVVPTTGIFISVNVKFCSIVEKVVHWTAVHWPATLRGKEEFIFKN